MRKPIGIALSILFFGGGAFFYLRIAGYHFIPAESWAREYGMHGVAFGWFAGLIGACGFAYLVKTNPKQANIGAVKLIFLTVLGFIVLWGAGYLVVICTVPMVHAAVVSEEVRLPYTVSDPNDHGPRFCRKSIEVKDMPFLLNNLCGRPAELGAILSPDNTVYAVGTGSRLGVYYSAFALRQ